MGTEIGTRNGFLRRMADVIVPPLAWVLVNVTGTLTWLFSERRDIATRNLAHAFPDRPEEWHRRIARRSVVGMMEMFFIPLVYAFLSDNELKRRLVVDDTTKDKLRGLFEKGKLVIQAPHSTLTEALPVIPMIIPGAKIATVYRPLDFGPAERFVRWSRSRCGMEMVSRKESLLTLRRKLSSGMNIMILFDQNAGKAGSLILSFGRTCSATELPGVMASRKSGGATCIVSARRTGFMRGEVFVADIPCDGSVEDITVRTTLVLEEIMRTDEDYCASWMWAHRRWKNMLAEPGRCLRGGLRKDMRAWSLKAMGLECVPRSQPYCVRVPSDPDGARAFARILSLWRERRPDVRWVLLVPESSLVLFREGDNCERRVALASPEASLSAVRGEWPEFFFSLEPDADSRREAVLCRAQYSVGITTRGRKGCKMHTVFEAQGVPKGEADWEEMLRALADQCGFSTADDA